MEANDFVANLKANGAEKDNCDLAKSFIEYTEILRKLSAKDKNSFSLNVLCILCRNLEKVPTWRDRIDNKDLLRLGIECVRHTRTLEAPEQVKTLACVYHLHKHVVKQNTSIPPELILKLSFMPFEYDNENLLKEYCKTYWSIIVDRVTYIEKLKTKRMPVTKLLPKLIDDVVQVIKIYDTVQFTINLLLFLVKKLYFIYSEISAKELNVAFGKIFDGISKKDLKQFKSLSDKDAMDLYVKLNDCLYIVTENALKNDSKDSVLQTVTRVCITLVGHRSDMFHCLQTLYSNSFCCIFKDKIHINLIDNTFNNLLVSCEMTEKLGYDTVIGATYPFISQLLRLFIENSVNKNIFNENSIENCLKLISLLLEKLRNTNQLLKCENCNVKSGLHDALRLSFHIKHFIAISTNQKLNINNILPTYYGLVEQQYLIINDLRTLGCVNQEKCFRKLQTDVHNTAITLNKAHCYEYSIKLFNIYLRNELKYVKNDVELRNISRALYNKSICELDFKLYEDSLKNAYLSLIFSLPEGLSSEKFMSLVMDIKAKALKSLNEDADNENNCLQTMTVLDICKLLYDDNMYGNLKPFMQNLKFSVLLKHEFSMYVKLWPSITPIAGVWMSLYDLVKEKHPCVKMENKEILLWTLFEIVLETPSAVRTIHDECYKTIVKELLVHFEKSQPSTIEEKIVSITLLFLQAEYDIAEASQKYGWKIVDHTVDPDQAEATRTVEQEHRAVSLALRATHELTDALPTLKTVKPSALIQNALQVFQVFVHQFLFLQRTLYGLQLAYVCCHIADLLGDKEAYVRNAGLLVYHSGSKRKEIDEIITKCMKYIKDLMNNEQSLDTALNYLSEVAIYYTKTGSIGVAAKLVQTVQMRLLRTHETHPDVDLQLSTGRLFEAQTALCADSAPSALSTLSALSAANGLQRHYLALSSSSSRWSARRRHAGTAAAAAVAAAGRAARLARALRVLRRAAAAAAPALARCAALPAALLHAALVDPQRTDDAQIKINNRMKYIVGLRTSSDVPLDHAQAPKIEYFTPKQTNLESMLDSMFKKTQVSPSLPCFPIPAFQTPDFLKHARTCTCYACDIPECTIIACLICYLEASIYYRAKEFDIAKNYFSGASKVFCFAEVKLNNIFDCYKKKFHSTVVDISKEMSENSLNDVQLEFLIEQAYFELSRNDFEKADYTVIRIHELLFEVRNIDKYLQNEITNLMIASAHLRKTTKHKEIGLENDFENLKLSPFMPTEQQKTPETKKIIPKPDTVIIVNDEEIPKKQNVILQMKLNFEEPIQEENVEKTKTKPKQQFKIPVPVISKPTLEKMTPSTSRSRPETTPRSTRSRPDIVIQQASIDEPATPKSEETGEFFTPFQSTPAEQFFTPMTSIKTYSRKVVKNLESEFSTPAKDSTEIKTRRSKVETGSIKAIKDKRSLKRATSPGKLVEEKPARPRRLRQPILTDK